MVMLALDTALNACSAALFDGIRPVAQRFEVMERGHAERLPSMVDELFREAGASPRMLSRVAVTRGPGTFTGVRIGLSYARGLGLALGIPVTGIDTLLATAVPHRGSASRLLMAHAAGGTGKCYAALHDGQTLAELRRPALLSAEDAGKGAGDALVIGTAMEAVLAAHPGLRAAARHHLPEAALFGPYALDLPPTEQFPEPLYVREADARPSMPASLATPTVRAAGLADVSLLAAIHGECFEPGWTAEMIRSSLSLPGSGALITELAGRAYGFVQFQWIAGEAEINTLCVSPPFRRQGFGRLLMEALIQELSARGLTKLFLEVAADNAEALALYRSLGFLQTGLRQGYYARKPGPAVDAITMTLVPCAT